MAKRAKPPASPTATSAAPATAKPKAQPAAMAAFASAEFLACRRCPRLVAHREAIAVTKRKAYREETYWGQPVPTFGDPTAPILLLGLAPGAHGSNRTGRHFTGDGSGKFLFPALFRAGFTNQPEATGRDDGLIVRDLLITAVGRCAPPENKPTRAELANCRHWLAHDLALAPNIRVVIALGQIAHSAFLDYRIATGEKLTKSAMKFAHGAEFRLGTGIHLVDSYHVSQQNTNTGTLTAVMFDGILQRARELAGLPTG